MPEAATKETKAGLLAFVEYWYEAVSYSYVSGDTQRLRTLAGGNCSSCENLVKLVRDSHAADKWMVGGKLTVLRSETDFVPNSTGRYQVLVEFEQEKLRVYNHNGVKAETEVSKEPFYHLFVATYTGDGWSLVDTGPPTGAG
ncbi:DUF6318 family protein [Arthrobacter sp. H14]|uniref:DUF6318 family protein n=1 Tax=Arthrobacter sp. H14 TaxID=1312959 RepID=UPI0012DF1B15|nr:DUF6318 family protein [Arthrobacter sp. H14]